MLIRDKLYKINNRTISKSINIDDSLYSQITKLSQRVYDATISEIINVAIEEYIEKNKPTFYGKTEGETVSYRNLKLRNSNVKKLNEYSKKTGISFTRLINGAIKEFLDNQ